MNSGRTVGLLVLATLLSGCGTSPPRSPENLCEIFREKSDWYDAAQVTQKRWGVPIQVPFAIMSRLYRVGEPVVCEGLFFRTEFVEIPDGPLWLVAPRGSKLAAEAAKLCEEHFSGIAISTPAPEKALAHARWLLKANDGSGGQSLLSYHKPSLWAALAYTAEKTFDQLLGCWSAVYAPAPGNFGQQRGPWHQKHNNGMRLQQKKTMFMQ